MEDDNEIIIRSEPVANGFLVSASKSVGGYKVAYLPKTYVATRDEVIEALPSLYAAAEELTAAEGREDF